MGPIANRNVQKCMAFESSGFRMEKIVVGFCIAAMFLALTLLNALITAQAGFLAIILALGLVMAIAGVLWKLAK